MLKIKDYFFFFLRGTLAPFFRASERPIAMACFLLFTVLPDPPDLSVPALRLRIARFTLFWAAFPYLAITASQEHGPSFIEKFQETIGWRPTGW
jgi:hypothetical protein